jgi:putative endonuclease
MLKNWYVYITTNRRNWTLYTWVTSNLWKRIEEHKEKINTWFSSKYNANILVYYEDCWNIETAILRKKQIKASNRNKKVSLIEKINPERKDLSLIL